MLKSDLGVEKAPSAFLGPQQSCAKRETACGRCVEGDCGDGVAPVSQGLLCTGTALGPRVYPLQGSQHP